MSLLLRGRMLLARIQAR